MTMNRKIIVGIVCCFFFVLTVSACLNKKDQAMVNNLKNFSKTMRPVKGNPDSHYTLARYYQDRGKHRDAIIEFEKTIAITPDNARALYAMGVSYDFLNDFKRASECYKKALTLNPESAHIYFNNIGQSLFMQGKYDPAVRSFEKAVTYNEEFPNARIHNNLGRAYAMTGQYHLAMSEFVKFNKGTAAESILNRVLSESEKQTPVPAVAQTKSDDQTKAFSTKVAGFLENRTLMIAKVQQARNVALNVAQVQQSAGDAAKVCMEVLNGNGVKYAARDMRDYLNKKGFNVTRVNDGIKVLGTFIYYEKGYDKEAKILAGQLPVTAKLKEVDKLDVPQIKVRLLVGQNMVRQNVPKSVQEIKPRNQWIGA